MLSLQVQSAGTMPPPLCSAGEAALLLQDLENTAGSWDLYGQEDRKRYPDLQAEFFQRAAQPVSRRDTVLGFVGAGRL